MSSFSGTQLNDFAAAFLVSSVVTDCKLNSQYVKM